LHPLHNSIQNIQSSRTGDGLKRDQKELNKAELPVVYIQGETLPFIQINDQVRWEQISSIQKVNEGLPLTINSIEAINGDGNEATARRNPFWASITRIGKMINRGIECFPSSVKHNFHAATQRAPGFVRVIGEREMNRQKEFYETNRTEQTCNCAVSPHLTRMFDIFVPCCHLLHSSVPRSILVDSMSLIRSTEQEFVFDLECAERIGEEPSRERKNAFVSMAAHAIKKLSRTGVKMEDLLSWVKANWSSEGSVEQFVCNIPVSVIMTISAVQLHFGS
jgi:hypothetical protein